VIQSVDRAVETKGTMANPKDPTKLWGPIRSSGLISRSKMPGMLWFRLMLSGGSVFSVLRYLPRPWRALGQALGRIPLLILGIGSKRGFFIQKRLEWRSSADQGFAMRRTAAHKRRIPD
jgi:hypothetical protein